MVRKQWICFLHKFLHCKHQECLKWRRANGQKTMAQRVPHLLLSLGQWYKYSRRHPAIACCLFLRVSSLVGINLQSSNQVSTCSELVHAKASLEIRCTPGVFGEGRAAGRALAFDLYTDNSSVHQGISHNPSQSCPEHTKPGSSLRDLLYLPMPQCTIINPLWWCVDAGLNCSVV